jgi:AcrR family transcriptional regulator
MSRPSRTSRRTIVLSAALCDTEVVNEQPSHSAGNRIRQPVAVGLPPGSVDGARRVALEGAAVLFARHGFHNTSMRDLAEALQQQPSALYKHFPSKEHILAALVQLASSVQHNALLGALLDAGSDPVDQLAALVAENARFHAQWPLLAVLLNDEVHALPDDMLDAAVALRDASSQLLSRVLERGIVEHAFDLLDLPTTTAAITAMAVRIPGWFVPTADLDVDVLADRQVRLALRIVGAHREARRGGTC